MGSREGWARPTLPVFIELTQLKEDAPTTLYEGLAVQRVADSLLECCGRIQTGRLMDAATQARAEGLLSSAEWRRVRKGLQS